MDGGDTLNFPLLQMQVATLNIVKNEDSRHLIVLRERRKALVEILHGTPGILRSRSLGIEVLDVFTELRVEIFSVDSPRSRFRDISLYLVRHIIVAAIALRPVGE